eukprot:597812-Prymnesium_polylepis.1
MRTYVGRPEGGVPPELPELIVGRFGQVPNLPEPVHVKLPPCGVRPPATGRSSQADVYTVIRGRPRAAYRTPAGIEIAAYHYVSQATENDAIRAKNRHAPFLACVERLQLAKKPGSPTQNTHMIRNQAIQRVKNAHIGHQKHKSNP